jgi:hypothetical protein
MDVSVVVELEAHAVVDLVVLQGDVVLVDVVPLLDAELLRPRPGLRRDELLQVADGVVLVALDADLLPLRATPRREGREGQGRGDARGAGGVSRDRGGGARKGGAPGGR